MPNNFIQKIVKRIRRPIWEHIYPKTYWHMRFYDRRFDLRKHGNRTEVSWRGALCAFPIAYQQITRGSDSLAIVASGPSLLATPEEAWRGRDVCCVNGSILWAKQRGIRPRLYVVSDPGFAERRVDLIHQAVQIADIVCLSIRCLFEVLRQRPMLFHERRLLAYENINQPFRRQLYEEEELRANPKILLDGRLYQGRYVGISMDLGMGVFPGGTVALGATQIALGLGYRDLHFLGLDMKPSGQTRRFYAERRPEPSFIVHNFEQLILPSFTLLRQYCDIHGATLQNWSPDSAIPRHVVPAARSGFELVAE
jgi:Kdo-III transferase WaaZ